MTMKSVYTLIIQLIFLQQHFPIPMPCNIRNYALNGELLGILCEKRQHCGGNGVSLHSLVCILHLGAFSLAFDRFIKYHTHSCNN